MLEGGYAYLRIRMCGGRGRAVGGGFVLEERRRQHSYHSNDEKQNNLIYALNASEDNHITFEL